tara:strand:- start:746 stop:1345 length:600 start_codon:yes stop_codon:yes gene_type:complete
MELNNNISMNRFLLIFILISFQMQSQTDMKSSLPYYEIPDYPESYTAGSVAARMLDGLGFRYYWATEGLRAEDLAFRPNEDARTSAETIDHIYGLSQIIVNATMKKANGGDIKETEMTFEEKRKATLENIKTAADILRNSDDISQFKLIFGEREFPFWNNINGSIEDAVWHCGQIVSFRRSSGNPYNSKASVFTGKVRE